MYNTCLRVLIDLLPNEHVFFDPCVLMCQPCITLSCVFCLCTANPPTFFPVPLQCQRYREQASVLENQPTGTFVLQVHAVDADEGANGKVKYGLMHRDSAMPAFRIHPDTGRVVADSPDSIQH